MTEAKKQRLRERQIELLKMFEGDFYQEKKVGEEWYIKSFNGGTGRWQVSVFSAVSYRRYKLFQRPKDTDEKEEKPAPKVPWKAPTLESIQKNLFV